MDQKISKLLDNIIELLADSQVQSAIFLSNKQKLADDILIITNEFKTGSNSQIADDEEKIQDYLSLLERYYRVHYRINGNEKELELAANVNFIRNNPEYRLDKSYLFSYIFESKEYLNNDKKAKLQKFIDENKGQQK